MVNDEDLQRAAQRVRNGVVLLRREGKRIDLLDLDRLDVREFDHCPLGQTYGSYGKGVFELFSGLDEEAARCGFDASYEGESYESAQEEYELLTELWQDVVLQARQKRS